MQTNLPHIYLLFFILKYIIFRAQIFIFSLLKRLGIFKQFFSSVYFSFYNKKKQKKTNYYKNIILLLLYPA